MQVCTREPRPAAGFSLAAFRMDFPGQGYWKHVFCSLEMVPDESIATGPISGCK